MPTRLSIYNGALSILGERRLASLTDDVEPRYQLDEVYDNEFIDRLLQMGQWNFAGRTIELLASPSVTPPFGYTFGFEKPEDFIRTMGVWYDEFQTNPITRYADEGAFWYCDQEVIYVQFVSNDIEFGKDLSLWPHNFTEMAEHYMAVKVAPRLTGLDFDSDKLYALWKAALREAKAVDAMESPAKFQPSGSWARSRRGGSGGDRGSRTKLIG